MRAPLEGCFVVAVPGGLIEEAESDSIVAARFPIDVRIDVRIDARIHVPIGLGVV